MIKQGLEFTILLNQIEPNRYIVKCNGKIVGYVMVKSDYHPDYIENLLMTDAYNLCQQFMGDCFICYTEIVNSKGGGK